jgi:GNAT superfamily N-acetyltransferase
MTIASNLPTIKGYTWRGITPTDGPLLDKFEKTCASLDGATNLQTSDERLALAKEENISTRSMLAINAHNEIAIAGWYEVDERVESVLAFLEGRVHPDFRGKQYGIALLDWLEKNAGAKMKTVAGERECTYRIMFYYRAPDADALF